MNKVTGSFASAMCVLALTLSGCGGSSPEDETPAEANAEAVTQEPASESSSSPQASSEPSAPVAEPASDTSSSDDEAADGDSSFADGVLTTPDLKIVITEHKVIPAGEPGNEYSDKPVLAFWYETTNLTDEDVSPMDFIFYFEAYQDNNPNAENRLEVSSLPDDKFRETQMENIKKDGTVENAMAYELDDETTPVDLVASDFMTEFGKTTYNLDGSVSDAAPEDASEPTPAVEEDSESDAGGESAAGEPTFEDGVLTTSDLKIVITDHKVIPAGDQGNEYGDKPVIAFWYETTNLSDEDVSPMDFLWHIEAYQDNNPNAENTLEVAGLPDDQFLDTQTETIKKGGTVANAMAYELDDETTPVDLVASDFMTEFGKTTYDLE
ncbi:DUF5067 domain-containing protein [Ornithinimicrobium faecis]|uniref:DUF5067 domain-containing protein n=1 Tax=Ornithinimicrobium faecis TaxID=2934158 RepID=A0ABY4YRB5_9MICO|nr:DUF5067 domain-containing protein [Ornithinimicrobium sp. HY1793]USQ79131.1 DUF5067 domain-containing protein [Ornithinimicrobium sp. HY1793]